MRYFPFMFVPVLVSIAILNLVTGSTDASYVNLSSNNATTRVSTDYSNINSSSTDDETTRFSTDDSYVNTSAGDVTRFSTDDSYVNTSAGDVTRFSTDDSYVNTSRDDATTRFSTDDSYVNISRDDLTRLHQAAGTCDNLRQCQNGGICIPRDGLHFCDCLSGTSGDLCEIVDECLIVDKCKDGSKCVFDVEMAKAICHCADPNLKYDSVDGKCKKTCVEDAMCKNGGLCMHRGNYLFCQCKSGTSGTFCELVDDPCENYSCENDGRCELYNGLARCVCKIPFFGDHCEFGEEDPCRDYTCENNGTCIALNGTQVPVCDCPSPFYGDRCELGGNDKIDRSLYNLIWILSSVIVLLILLSCGLLITICRKKRGS